MPRYFSPKHITMKNRFLSLALLASLGFLACGPSKKMRQAMADIQRLDSTRAALSTQVVGLEQNLGDLRAKLADQTRQNDSLQQSVAALNRTVGDLNRNNSDLSSRLGTAAASNATQQQKLEALESSLQQQRRAMQELRSKIAGALNKFSSEEIKVTYKNGLVFVSMQDKLLFNTASAKLDIRGKEALKSFAVVLNENPDIKVMVLGNTDSIPIRTVYTDNWSLSTERANTIVRILSKDDQVDPARLTAAGESKYSPVADNSTPEGRAQNRRTDIVLTPDLSKVWDLVNSSGP